ncbi:MAG TPA: FeoB small GTPase domain-containing protein [Bacilli bacterium]|nr:FeoB small GTPase domain-containing protein [Bacilli bacterium]
MSQEQAQTAPSRDELVIALAGNPNTGKSTVFNALTGLRQHTGNWAGKTVGSAIGRYRHQERTHLMVDLPGTYSLLSQSADEQVARDFICFAKPQATLVVTDATCLERNLNLALQVMEVTSKVVVAVNLMDEAKRKGITVDIAALTDQLGVPVVPIIARSGKGLDQVKETVFQVATDQLHPQPKPLVYHEEVEAAIAELIPQVEPLVQGLLPARWVALRLLDGDDSILTSLEEQTTSDGATTTALMKGLVINE